MEADKTAIRKFLETLLGSEPSGFLVVWTRPDKVTRAFDLARPAALDQCVEYCAARAETRDVYTGAWLLAEKPPKGSRGKEQDVKTVSAVWADVDVAGTTHSEQKLPPSAEDARRLVSEMGLPPSIVVHSGHGLQVYWLLREPLVIESEMERAVAKSRSVRFQLRLQQLASAHGWTTDSTSDLCRVLRVPGTFNRKIPKDIRSVTAEYFDYRYNIDDIEELLVGIAVTVWLDDSGNLRIDKDAPPDIKETARRHKEALVAVLRAQAVVNNARIRLVRLPLGNQALAKPPGPLPEEVSRAIETLRLDSLPLVINDAGLVSLPYRTWLLKEVFGLQGLQENPPQPKHARFRDRFLSQRPSL